MIDFGGRMENSVAKFPQQSMSTRTKGREEAEEVHGGRRMHTIDEG